MMKDYYEILQVHIKAEPEIVQAAYKRLTRKYHPDTCDLPDAEERMKEINQAYEVLNDPDRRKEYDALRAVSDEPASYEEEMEIPDQEPGEYHYRTEEKTEFYRKPYEYQYPQEPESLSRSYQNTYQANSHSYHPHDNLEPTIVFCTKTDGDLNPVDPTELFPPNAKTIFCCIEWENNQPAGTEIKIIWYCNNEIAWRHSFRFERACGKLQTGITQKGFFSPYAGSWWEVYVTQDGKNIGTRRFRILSNREYKEKLFLEGKANSPIPGLWQLVADWLKKH